MEKFQLSIQNLNNLWSFIEVYAVLFQIYVEKNLCRENLCGEKMTNMRSDQRQYLLEIIFVFVLLLGMTLLNECVNLLRSNGLQNSQEKTF